MEDRGAWPLWVTNIIHCSHSVTRLHPHPYSGVEPQWWSSPLSSKPVGDFRGDVHGLQVLALTNLRTGRETGCDVMFTLELHVHLHPTAWIEQGWSFISMLWVKISLLKKTRQKNSVWIVSQHLLTFLLHLWAHWFLKKIFKLHRFFKRLLSYLSDKQKNCFISWGLFSAVDSSLVLVGISGSSRSVWVSVWEWVSVYDHVNEGGELCGSEGDNTSGYNTENSC